jgi:hypothetical protein
VKGKIPVIIALVFLLGLSIAVRNANASVYNYSITSATQTAPDTVVVSAQCEFCTACYPNDNNEAGCTPFEPGDPAVIGPGYHSCGVGSPAGRFAAVRLVSSKGVFAPVTQKLVTNQQNWPLGSLWAHNFVFSGLTIDSTDTITAYTDFYCSWCYHWYSDPQTVVITNATKGQLFIDYKTENGTVFDFGNTVKVTIEVNTTLSSQYALVDTSLIDPNSVVQDYQSWTGTVVPGPDPITQYLHIPASGVVGNWKVFVTVLNSTGNYQDSKVNFITVGKQAIKCATVASVWTTNSTGAATVEYKAGETVYLHWKANGNVNITVFDPSSNVEQNWLNLDAFGDKSFVPSHGPGIYSIECRACKQQKLIAYGTFLVIPETVLGTIGALGAAIASMGMFKLRIRKAKA